jgi:hypothetical protein
MPIERVTVDPPAEADVLHDLAVASQLMSYRKNLQRKINEEADYLAQADEGQLRNTLTSE